MLPQPYLLSIKQDLDFPEDMTSALKQPPKLVRGSIESVATTVNVRNAIKRESSI